MTDFVLSAKRRQVLGKKVASIRNRGQVPAVLYGHGVENHSIEVERQPFLKLFEQAGASSLVDLTIDKDAPVKVLVQDIQRDPVTDQIVHADFYQVNMKEMITATIEIAFIGESPAVKELGGILVKNKTSLNVKSLPGDLVHEIELNISGLKAIEDSIHVKDLNIPEAIEVLDNPDDAVILVAAPRTEAEIASLDEEVKEDVGSVAVAGEDKESEEGEDGEASGGKASSTDEKGDGASSDKGSEEKTKKSK